VSLLAKLNTLTTTIALENVVQGNKTLEEELGGDSQVNMPHDIIQPSDQQNCLVENRQCVKINIFENFITKHHDFQSESWCALARYETTLPFKLNFLYRVIH